MSTHLLIHIIQQVLAIVIANLLTLPSCIVVRNKAESRDCRSVEEGAQARGFKTVDTSEDDLLVVLKIK